MLGHQLLAVLLLQIFLLLLAAAAVLGEVEALVGTELVQVHLEGVLVLKVHYPLFPAQFILLWLARVEPQELLYQQPLVLEMPHL
jgi:hypothetical protein